MKKLNSENLGILTAFILACGFLFVEQDGAEQRFFCYVSFAFLSFPLVVKVIKYVQQYLSLIAPDSKQFDS